MYNKTPSENFWKEVAVSLPVSNIGPQALASVPNISCQCYPGSLAGLFDPVNSRSVTLFCCAKSRFYIGFMEAFFVQHKRGLCWCLNVIPNQFAVAINVPQPVWSWYTVPPAPAWAQLKRVHQNSMRIHTLHGFLHTLSYMQKGDTESGVLQCKDDPVSVCQL